MSSGAFGPGLSLGYSRARDTHESGLRQRASRLARLCRSRGGAHAASAATVCRHSFRVGPGGGPVRFGRDADRVEPGAVSVGALAKEASLGEVQRAAGLARRHPVFASLHEGNRHEVASLDEIPVYSGSYYAIDRGYLDFARLHRLHKAGAFFVTRLKAGIRFYVVESRPIDKTVGLRCDQTIKLSSRKGRRDYPDPLRRISYIDPENGEALVFLTNCFALEALLIAQIYRRRWGIELFWRWIKQHLRLRGFFSNSPNGVRVQIWAALCAYLLIAIAKQNKHLDPSLYEILQVVSVSSLEQISVEELFAKVDTTKAQIDNPKQLEINYS